jgi:hypothetical protein
MTEIDWGELIKLKKSLTACDEYYRGNVIAQYHYDIKIIIEGATIKSHECIVPKYVFAVVLVGYLPLILKNTPNFCSYLSSSSIYKNSNVIHYFHLYSFCYYNRT